MYHFQTNKSITHRNIIVSALVLLVIETRKTNQSFFSIAEIKTTRVNNCFMINSKQMIKMPKKGECFTFKSYKRKIKSRFVIYADFECIIIPKDNEKQNPAKFYTNKYHKCVFCSHVCTDNNFSKAFNV